LNDICFLKQYYSRDFFKRKKNDDLVLSQEALDGLRKKHTGMW